MECGAKMKPLLRASTALRRVLVLAPGSRRRIHFPPGPTLSTSDDEQDRSQKPRRWFRASYARLLRHAASIRTTCWLPHAAARAAHFDALAGEFVSSSAASIRLGGPWLSSLRPTSLSSLTRVCDVLGVSAQRRKAVRLTVCPQVTHHHVWRGALDEILRDLQAHIASLESPSPSLQMAEQIASACTQFLSTTADESSSSSWMRPAPFKPKPKPKPAAGSSPRPPQAPVNRKTWQEVLDMFADLAKSLDADSRLAAKAHMAKVEAMKEGLYQIRDVAVERGDVGFREARRQDCLVQYRLSKSLGHSSPCLYILLLFYLYGTVRDINVHVAKCIVSGKGGWNVTIHVAMFLTEGDESAVRAGVKQLSQALGVFRFVWEAAHSESDGGAVDSGKGVVVKKKKGEDGEGALELQGHLWGFGVQEKELTYRGNVFHVHQIQMP